MRLLTQSLDLCAKEYTGRVHSEFDLCLSFAEIKQQFGLRDIKTQRNKQS